MEVTLSITFNQGTGQLSVNGPIDNAMLAYGMLEMARDLIAERRQHPVTSRLAVPRMIVPNGKEGA